MMAWHMWGPWLLIPVLMFVAFGPMRHHWWASFRRYRREYRGELEAPERDLQARQEQDQLTELERRVAELESGLDFAERLLSSRREPQELPRRSALQ